MLCTAFQRPDPLNFIIFKMAKAIARAQLNKIRKYSISSIFKLLLFILLMFPIFAIMKRNNIHILIAIMLVITATILRIVNHNFHLYNLAPMAAIGLFSGAVIKDRKVLAFLIPLAGQFIADLYFQLFTTTQGFYPGQFFNYTALAGAAGLGLLMKQPKPLTILAYVFGASGLFFLVSNFGFFVSGYNGYSFSGLVKTYIDAIPFYKNTIMGDMVGGVLLFGGYFIAQNIFASKLEKAKA